MDYGGLVDTVGSAHGALDVERLDVLPILLQERNQEIHSQLDVELEFGGLLLNVTDSGVQADNLLKLELDGGLHLIDLLVETSLVINEGGEFASLVQSRSKKTRDQLDDGRGSQEDVILSS